MPHPMTKAREGSQYPAKSRKFSTFACDVMPLAPRPRAKMMPELSGEKNARGLAGSITEMATNTSELMNENNGNSHLGGHWIGAI
mmetsp:Transcript_37393/g.66657  ORF Transcript_37393/g.66657 Transcript_37393/m.66657 type:complete len:85 (+) Transcript_37393:53-307(+)